MNFTRCETPAPRSCPPTRSAALQGCPPSVGRPEGLRYEHAGVVRSGERGVALVIALLAMMLMTALGMALMLVSETETLIGANYRDSVEGTYAADAGIERVMQDILTIPDWNTILTSPDNIRAGVTSGFIDSTLTPTLIDGRTINLASATNMVNCNKVTTCSDADMNANEGERQWSTNNPRYRLFAWGPINDLNPTPTLNSPFYLAVWIADDGAETDSDPMRDGGAAGGHVPRQPGQRRHDDPCRGLRARRHPSRDRSQHLSHRQHRARARVHGTARAGRTEPPRPQGGGADARLLAGAVADVPRRRPREPVTIRTRP